VRSLEKAGRALAPARLKSPEPPVR
jgi:hypothetical protein